MFFFVFFKYVTALFFFFFFQAEDGIRDGHVTGVQTCALPISPVTYFEALTALAFLWFADKPVGLGVFEVGMGGLWDATNLVAGDVAVIGPIALDHPELGPT